MATPKVYLFCDQNCKFEGMTKEQILSAILQAVSTGEIKDVDAGFVQTIKTINGLSVRFFYGTQAAFNALKEEEKENLVPIITNDVRLEELATLVADIQKNLSNLATQLASGDFKVGSAQSAISANAAAWAAKVMFKGSAKTMEEVLAGSENFNTEGTYPNVTVGHAITAGTAIMTAVSIVKKTGTIADFTADAELGATYIVHGNKSALLGAFDVVIRIAESGASMSSIAIAPNIVEGATSGDLIVYGNTACFIRGNKTDGFDLYEWNYETDNLSDIEINKTTENKTIQLEYYKLPFVEQ